MILAALLLALQAPAAPANLVCALPTRADSAVIACSWTVPPGTSSSNIRLVAADLVLPPAGTDVDVARYWNQTGSRTVDTIRVPYPTPAIAVQVIVRACAASCSAFTAGPPFLLQPAVKPLPQPTGGRYAYVTLKNGFIEIGTRDSLRSWTDTLHETWWQVYSATKTNGVYRGFHYNFTRGRDVILTAAALRNAADNLDEGAWARDTFNSGPLPSSPAGFGTRQVRCATPVGCWATFTNPPLTGSWTTSPKIPAAVLRGLAAALEHAWARRPLGDERQVASDSLPFNRVLP